MEHVKERTVRVGDTELHLLEWGEKGRPVLFWHALGDHTALQPIEVAPTLVSEHGAHVLGVDAPGFGRSPRLPDERYEMPRLVELAEHLADELGLERFVWMGSSWGANVGVHFAVTHPERLSGLVLVDGRYFDYGEQGLSLDELREYWRSQPSWSFDSWEAVDEEAKAAFGRWTPSIQAVVRDAYRDENGRIVSIMGPDVYAAAIHGVHEAPPAPVIPELGRTRVPVLLLAATQPPEKAEERRPDLERFERVVPSAEIHRVEGARHWMLEDAPDYVARAVGEWLAPAALRSPR